MRARLLPCLLALALCAGMGAARALGLDTETVRLAATGQYGALQSLLEAEQTRLRLGTRDLHALCYAYAQTKQYELLFACLQQLERQVAQGDKRTRLFGLDDATPSIALMRAQAWLELGQYERASAQARAVIDWIDAEGSDDRDFELQALATLVVAHALNGERAEALRLQQVLAGMSTAFALFDDYTPVRVFALARGHVALGQYAQALALLEGDHYFKLRRFLDQIFSGAALQGENYWMWADLPRAYLLAKCRLELGRLPEAQADLDRLLALPATQANGEIHWMALFDRGRIAEQQGALAQAQDFYQRAASIVERQRASIHTEVNKIGFVADKQLLYERLIATSARSDSPAHTLAAVERAKSRALVDLLASKQDFGPGSTQALRPLERARAQLTHQLASSAQTGLRAIATVEQARAELQTQQPGLAALVSAAPSDWAQLQPQLGANELLLEYYHSGDTLLALLASGGPSAAVQRFILLAPGLQDEVRALRQALTPEAGADRHAAAPPQVQALAQRLHQRLIAPLQTQLAGKDLLIVPHGVLHYLPFALLHDGHTPLVARHRLRTLPSASVLAYLPPAAAPAQKVLILGNPDLRQAQLDLPYAEQEAQAIARLWPAHRLLLRAAASKAALTTLAPDYPYIHLASHGLFSPQDPLASRLLLAAAEGQDGALRVDDLYQLRLQARLVVLSACESGLGGLGSGDDLIGLGRALLYAGASNTLASLWPVDDASTAQWMHHFYQALAQGQPPTQALAQAQNQLRQRYPHPYYWAAFYLSGSGR